MSLRDTRSFALATFAAALLLALPPSAGALTIAHEPFDYDIGGFGTPNGGTGFDGAWANSAFDNSVVAGLTFSGVASSGNAVLVRGMSNPDRGTRFVDMVQPGNGEELWVGFLVQFPRTNSGFGGISISASNVDNAGLGIGATGAFEIAFTETRVPGGGVSTGITPALDTTYFLVARIRFQDGNDIAELYVNPDPTVTPTVPDAVKSDFGIVQVSQLNLSAFQDGTQVIVDEIRYGQSFADVVATVPEPGAAALLGLGLVALARRRGRARS